MLTLTGSTHSLAVDSDGCVWGSGANSNAQLGLKDFLNRRGFTKQKTLPPIAMVSCGVHHSLFLDESGAVWGCGKNDKHQLATLVPQNENEIKGETVLLPCLLENLPKIQQIACGAFHSLFLDEEGSVWGCGSNEFHQVNASQNARIAYPTKIPQLPRIIAISCGSAHSLLMDEEGGAWISGNKGPQKVSNLPPIKMICSGYEFMLLVDDNDQVWRISTIGSFAPEKLNLPNPVISMACGQSHCLFLDSQFQVYASGKNDHGQLGFGDLVRRHDPQLITSLPQILAISCGANHSMFVENENTIWACGDDSQGQLGTGKAKKLVIKKSSNVGTPEIIPFANLRIVDLISRETRPQKSARNL